jgi:hypothetical protein
VQFTAGEEYVKLVEEARALLSHSAPRATLDEIQLRAMRALVAELKRRKHAVAAPPQKPGCAVPTPAESAAAERPQKPGCAVPTPAESIDADRSTAEPESAQKSESEPEHLKSESESEQSESEPEHPRSDAEAGLKSELGAEHPPSDTKSELKSEGPVTAAPPSLHPVASEHPRRRGRYVPAAVRRAVFERDEGRCTYADSSGRRCVETHRLELHHLRAFARGGEHTVDNLTLRCHAHNALAAEEDFGRPLIELARGVSEHEPWAVQSGV